MKELRAVITIMLAALGLVVLIGVTITSLGCHNPPEPFTANHMRQADLALREATRPNPLSPCIDEPQSEACRNEALSHRLIGPYGWITVDRCWEAQSDKITRPTVRNTYMGACKHALNYIQQSDGLRDECFELHWSSPRCLDLFDLDQSGMLTHEDWALLIQLELEPTMIWQIVESHPMEGE